MDGLESLITTIDNNDENKRASAVKTISPSDQKSPKSDYEKDRFKKKSIISRKSQRNGHCETRGLREQNTTAPGEKMPFILLPIKIIDIYICMIMITILHSSQSNFREKNKIKKYDTS